MDLTYRKADLEDTLAIKDILTAAVHYKLAHHDLSWGEEPFSEREVRGLIKTNATYVVVMNGELIATFGLHWSDERIWGGQPDDAGYIHRLAIKEGYHGHDYGRQILSMVTKEVSDKGRKYLRLDCDERNEHLCAYYEKHGFELVGRKLIPSDRDYYANLYQRTV